jgi:GTP cyclohydrolase FolE2
MARIINFWEAKLSIEMRELKARLEYEYDEKQRTYWEARKAEYVEDSMKEAIKDLPKPPKKRALVISAFTGGGNTAGV